MLSITYITIGIMLMLVYTYITIVIIIKSLFKALAVGLIGNCSSMNKLNLLKQAIAVAVWIVRFTLMAVGVIGIIAAAMLVVNSTETFHIIMGCIFWICSLVLIIKMGGKLL